MFVKPPGPRHTATEQGDALTIRIPSKRNIFKLGFLTIWLCGWLVGEIMGIVGFFSAIQKEPEDAAFMVVWLSLWSVGGAFAICLWFWQVKGCEVIMLSSTALGLKRELFGYGRIKHYDIAQIRLLRVAPATFNPFDFRSGMTFWGIGNGVLAFDYGFKTFRFGEGIDEAEARIILQTMTNRLPRLSQASGTKPD